MISWPMDILTREYGSKEKRKLLVKPRELIGRDNISIGDEFQVRRPDLLPFSYPCTYHLETKEQGHFHFLCRDAGEKYMVFGRRLNVEGGFTDIASDLVGRMSLPHLPPETVLAFELVWPGHPDSSVPTAIKSCPQELVVKAIGLPIYKASILFGRSSLKYFPGRELLESVMGFPELCVEYQGSFTWNNMNEAARDIAMLLTRAKKENLEGFVLKGKHYADWWKFKVLRDADVFITDFNISDAETRAGLVTSVDVGVMDVDGETIVNMGSVSGFDLEEMERMTQSMSAYKDAVLRIVYQEVAAQGKLKHGFFAGWRDDKNTWECTVEQFV